MEISISHVTVIVSTFNGEAYIKEAVESVLKQTHQDFEFTIIDDASSDQTFSILQSLALVDSRLKISKNRVNRGVGFSYSQLIAQAKGEYIACIGQDDVWDSQFLEMSLAALKKNPNASASFSRLRIIDSRGLVQNSSEMPFRMDFASSLNREDLLCALLKQNFLCAASATFRRKDVENWQTHGDNDQLQDWETWLHLILKGEFIFLENCLMSYRIHGNNLSMANRSPMQIQTELIHTRTSVFSSESFARYVLEHSSPDTVFQKILTAVSEVIDPKKSIHYDFLLFALKRNEHLLSSLPSYCSIMSMLYLHAGAITRSNRYVSHGNPIKTCPPIFWQGFEWRTLITNDNSNLRAAYSPFIKEQKIGKLVIYKFLSKKNHLTKFGLLFGSKAKSAELLIEQYLDFHSSRYFKKLVIILRLLGLDSLIATVKQLLQKK